MVPLQITMDDCNINKDENVNRFALSTLSGELLERKRERDNKSKRRYPESMTDRQKSIVLRYTYGILEIC